MTVCFGAMYILFVYIFIFLSWGFLNGGFGVCVLLLGNLDISGAAGCFDMGGEYGIWCIKLTVRIYVKASDCTYIVVEGSKRKKRELCNDNLFIYIYFLYIVVGAMIIQNVFWAT